LLTVRRGWLDVLGLPQDTLRGCLPISGVYQFTTGSGLPQRPRFLGDDPDNDRDASPQHNIEGEVPPFLLAHGSQDFPHLITQAENFERALREHGATVTRLVLEGRDHFSASYAGGEADGPWVPPALDFIARHA
jgi:dipeptidyl aminopeptidase/acylaminoacyl peptidase